MAYVVIPLVAMIVSGLTLFSGFGLGTLLMPVFAVFFPLNVAVAMTAVVHLFNNLFKVALLGRNADRRCVLGFGVPAIFAALLGAALLIWLADLPDVAAYQIGQRAMHITSVKVIVAVLMVAFALIEVLPRFEKLTFDKKFLPLGGVISGFFGGLSGHQGALRSAFLIRAGLTKGSFIATGVVVACMVDLSRLSIYFTHFAVMGWGANKGLLITTTLAACVGSFIGNKFVKKITLRVIQVLVSVMLVLIAIALAAGLI